MPDGLTGVSACSYRGWGGISRGAALAAVDVQHAHDGATARGATVRRGAVAADAGGAELAVHARHHHLLRGPTRAVQCALSSR